MLCRRVFYRRATPTTQLNIELIFQDESLTSLQKEVSYLKQELIEARAHKSASDDQLGNVSGKLETLENTITSLSDEGKDLDLT